MNRSRVIGLVMTTILALAPIAHAALCGDDVDGRDVPCACGDTVVSDLALDGDPVLDGVCPDDGLVVRAPAATLGITVDLRGTTLRGGGRGAGIWVVDVGGGARIVSTSGAASIEGFRDGILAVGTGTVTLIDGVTVVGSGRDGLRVSSEGYEIRGTEVRGSGRDGFSLAGKRFRVVDTRARDSGRFGYFVMGADVTLGAAGTGVESDGSGAHGFQLMGMAHRVTECAASRAGKHGVHLHAMDVELRGCVATGNQGTGITGEAGGHWTLAGNQALDNAGNGIVIDGPAVFDGGGNLGSGNQGGREGRSPVQCEIGGEPCR